MQIDKVGLFAAPVRGDHGPHGSVFRPEILARLLDCDQLVDKFDSLLRSLRQRNLYEGSEEF